MSMQILNKQKGFSLIGLIVSLAIIGIVLVNTLFDKGSKDDKGAGGTVSQKMDKARMINHIQKINGLSSAISTYIDRYGYTAFNEKSPAQRFKALSEGGLVSGYSGGNFLSNEDGSSLHILLSSDSRENGLSGILVCAQLDKKASKKMDVEHDDGNKNGGSLRVFLSSSEYSKSSNGAICTSSGQ